MIQTHSRNNRKCKNNEKKKNINNSDEIIINEEPNELTVVGSRSISKEQSGGDGDFNISINIGDTSPSSVVRFDQVVVKTEP